MKWLKNIFGKSVTGSTKDPARVAAEAPLAREIHAPDAATIQKQSMDEWSRRLHHEGIATSNSRMVAQAQNIRQRWGLPPCVT